MKKNLTKLAVAGFIGLSTFAASADDAYQGSWYVLPGVSFMNTDSDLDADNDIGGFLRIGKELSQHWDIQLGLSHARADEDLNVPGGNGKYKQTLLGVDALYMFSRDRFRPFVLAGLGLAHNDLDYDVAGVDIGTSKTSWMANVGLGAQFMVTESLGLQADVRHVWSRANAKSNAKVVGGMDFNDAETVGNTYLNLGAIWKFGAPKKMAAAEPEPMPEPAMAAPEPMPAPAPVACKPKFETITITAEKLFAFDKSSLTPDGRQVLDSAADKIKSNPDIELVLVTGHTDRIGSDAYNQKLSERRANQVKDYLISQGVAESRLQAVGKGESEPVVNCAGVHGSKNVIECLQPNRRVVISAEKQRESGCK